MKRNLIVLAVLIAVSSPAWSQETIVFPAVTDEQPGRHDSLWVTSVRLFKVDPEPRVTVRRKWVCLPEGGFADDPATAPTWTMLERDPFDRVLVKWGGDLLSNTGATIGAIGLEIIGDTELLAHSVVMDVNRGSYHPGAWSFGQGQLVPAMREPLVGASHIPWIGGCRNDPCSQQPPTRWDYLRNNIGIANPNPEPLTIRGKVIPISYMAEFFRFSEYPDPEPEVFVKTIRPYGWLQFRWVAEHFYGEDQWAQWQAPWPGFIISLTPDRDDLPYYAYASVVFTPDPDSDIPVFNDPMFVPAEPGYVAPIREVYPQPKGKGE